MSFPTPPRICQQILPSLTGRVIRSYYFIGFAFVTRQGVETVCCRMNEAIYCRKTAPVLTFALPRCHPFAKSRVSTFCRHPRAKSQDLPSVVILARSESEVASIYLLPSSSREVARPPLSPRHKLRRSTAIKALSNNPPLPGMVAEPINWRCGAG